MVRVTPLVGIPESELRFVFTTSRGPGGQNVNKVATRAVLLFDVGGSRALDEHQRARVREALASRISRDGILRIACSRSRSQDTNKSGAVELFARLLREALKVRRKRRPSAPTKASIGRRLSDKAARGRRKRERRGGSSSEE